MQRRFRSNLIASAMYKAILYYILHSVTRPSRVLETTTPYPTMAAAGTHQHSSSPPHFPIFPPPAPPCQCRHYHHRPATASSASHPAAPPPPATAERSLALPSPPLPMTRRRRQQRPRRPWRRRTAGGPSARGRGRRAPSLHLVIDTKETDVRCLGINGRVLECGCGD